MEFEIEQNDTFHDTLVKCVKHYLQNESNPSDLGYILALEAINVLTSFAPNSPAAYVVLFDALKSFNSEAVNETSAESKDEIDDRQNAPSTRRVQ